MKITTKFFSSSAFVITVISVLLGGSNFFLWRAEKFMEAKTNQAMEAFYIAKELEVTLGNEVVALGNFLLLSRNAKDMASYQKAMSRFIIQLDELEELFPQAQEIEIIRLRHQNLVLLAKDLTDMPTPLPQIQQDFRAINSFTRDIKLYLDSFSKIVHEQYYLAQRQKNLFNRVTFAIELLILGLILCVFVVQFRLIFLPMIRSLQKLQQGAAKIGAGDLDYRLNIQTNDEVEELAFEFNQMGAKLADLYHSLEEKVQERTAKLAETNNYLEQEIQERQNAEIELRQNAQQLRRQNLVLIGLGKEASLIEGNLSKALQKVTAATAHTLDIARVSVWMYDEQKTYLECLNLFTKTDNQHSKDIKVYVKDYPVYFQALSQDKPIVADNAHTDERTSEFSAIYFTPLGINSLLDVPIVVRGKTVGVLCMEQVGVERHWTIREENFARAIADLITLGIEARDRALAQKQLQQSETKLKEQAQKLQETLLKLQQTQAHLIQSEKMSSLGQMVAGIAHEINNPVNFIHGNVNHAKLYSQDILGLVALYQKHYPDPDPEIEEEIEAIDLDFLSEDFLNLMDSMRMGSERIRAIVKSLRTFSRLDEAEVKEVDIHESIDSTLLILHNRLKAKSDRSGIELVKEYGDLPLVECYSGQLNQVFMNIFDNAIDALTEGNNRNKEGANRQIYIQTLLNQDNWVTITIADNGIGMDEQVCAKIFDPFFTTKAVGKGTGLGLAISYQIIVDKHGGKIWCDSSPGKGCKFVVKIPLKPII